MKIRRGHQLPDNEVRWAVFIARYGILRFHRLTYIKPRDYKGSVATCAELAKSFFSQPNAAGLIVSRVKFNFIDDEDGIDMTGELTKKK